MNEELFLNRILDDANIEAKKIIDSANTEIDNLKKDLNEFDNQLNKNTSSELEKYKEKCLENYENILKFNKNKLILEVKNFVLNDVQIKAVEKIKNLKKY